MSGGNGQPTFQVIYSGVVRQRLKALLRKATKKGLGKKALRAVIIIDRRLHDRPRTFGEALYSLPGVKLQVRQGIIQPIVVYWAVHNERPLVFVKEFKILPGV